MTRPLDFNDLLARIPNVKLVRPGEARAPCPLPGHKTPENHLSIKDGGDKALVACQGGRHSYRDFCQAWGYDSLSYSSNGKRAEYSPSNNGNGCQPVNGMPNQPQNRVDTGADRDVNGVSLTSLAAFKHLPVDFLKSLGISNCNHNGQRAVRIPYNAEDGTEQAIRFRLSLTAAEGSRFKWRKGDRALPYGLNRLAAIRRTGWVMIVEGESDCWTCWFHNIPALGAPGKSIWRPAWAEYLAGLEIFLWQEPESEDFT